MKNNLQEKFLIQLCGLPGTGKSSIARALINNLDNYTLIDQNQIRRNQGMKRMPKTQDATLRLIDQLTAEYLRAGKGVVVDSVNRYSFRRHQLYGVASSCKTRVITLEAFCSERTAKKRIRSRRSSDGLLSDPSDIAVYDKLKSLWEDVQIDFKYPGEDHVAYLRFNTETHKLNPVVSRPNMKPMLTRMQKILGSLP